MTGLSRTNLLYMRAFAAAWPEPGIVQRLVGRLPWGHNLELLDKLDDPAEREWYARAAIEHGWSRPCSPTRSCPSCTGAPAPRPRTSPTPSRPATPS